jgi:hypothetical protein
MVAKELLFFFQKMVQMYTTVQRNYFLRKAEEHGPAKVFSALIQLSPTA